MKFLRRLLGKPNSPDVVEFHGARFDERHLIVLKVTREQCLARDEFQELARFGAGVQHWWLLRSGSGSFALIDFPRGDVAFERALLLPSGRYVLGALARDSGQAVQIRNP